jgi:hypothetical protein
MSEIHKILDLDKNASDAEIVAKIDKYMVKAKKKGDRDLYIELKKLKKSISVKVPHDTQLVVPHGQNNNNIIQNLFSFPEMMMMPTTDLQAGSYKIMSFSRRIQNGNVVESGYERKGKSNSKEYDERRFHRVL